jgi:hypothetical protein
MLVQEEKLVLMGRRIDLLVLMLMPLPFAVGCEK